MDKEEVVYTHHGVLFSHRKEIPPLVTTCIGLEGTMLSEVSQREKDHSYVEP